jgi:hypothetical protein
MSLWVLDWKSLIEMLKNKNENIFPLKTFDCVCFVQDNGFNVKFVKCIFVGYLSTQKGYICWNPVKKRLFMSIDVIS